MSAINVNHNYSVYHVSCSTQRCAARLFRVCVIMISIYDLLPPLCPHKSSVQTLSSVKCLETITCFCDCINKTTFHLNTSNNYLTYWNHTEILKITIVITASTCPGVHSGVSCCVLIWVWWYQWGRIKQPRPTVNSWAFQWVSKVHDQNRFSHCVEKSYPVLQRDGAQSFTVIWTLWPPSLFTVCGQKGKENPCGTEDINISQLQFNEQIKTWWRSGSSPCRTTQSCIFG